MARPRKKSNQGLPPYLHFDKSTYFYRYRHPETGKYHSMGKDRSKAIGAAKQLNSLLMPGQDLIASVMGNNMTFQQFIETRFLPKILPERHLSQSTLRDYNNKLRHITEKLGEKLIDEVSVKHIADFLAAYPPTQSNRYRSLLTLIFKYATAEGLCDINPAANTMNRKVVKARQRLNLVAYQAIHALAEPWLQNAMDLALLTLQRRDDTARLQFTDIKDEHLYVIQQKTEKHGASAHIKIQIGSDLQKVIQRCRDDVLSPYLVHKVPERHVKTPKKSHYTQINGEYISKAFSAARDMTGLFDKMPAIERPTFHEIRSLGIKLYEDNGSNAQFLAGHTTRKMTEAYKQGHEIAWTPAIANLTLPAPQ